MALSPNYANGLPAISQSAGLAAFASGFYTGGWVAGDGAGALPIAVNLGFTPRYVKLINLTSGDQYEWIAGMGAGITLKSVAAGTSTLDATGVIVTNYTTISTTEMATAAPGYQGPGYGTTGTVVVLQDYVNRALPSLTFNSAAAGSGAPVNASGVNYAWVALG